MSEQLLVRLTQWNRYILKGQVQGLGWFLTRFQLKFAENNDVGEIVIWGLNAQKQAIFCHTESVTMTLKIICTLCALRHSKDEAQ